MRLVLHEPRWRSSAIHLAVATLAVAQLGTAQPLVPSDFVAAAEQGFGDRQNSIPWSMVWWRDHLYVGTGRASFCTTSATNARFYRFRSAYPPRNPNVECTPAPEDLPLAAEIWRWTPATDDWELVYRSPVDVELPDFPGRFVARDIGFRGMTIATEPDGTEALYAGGVSARSLFGPTLPPPRILRSTDGELFEPLPQQAGTFLGDLSAVGFRTLASFAGRLYAIASNGLLGYGVILEAENPAAGNDAFRRVSPDGLTFFEMTPYNGALYAGTGVQALNDPTPYAVMKTRASGTPPYEFATVLGDAAYSTSPPHPAVISMHVFGDDLFIGTDRELLRIHADDTWDLIVGRPRDTPAGPKRPLSGLDLGFDQKLNIHVWRMATYAGWLYVGTQDQSAQWIHLPGLSRLLGPTAGFDLYASPNGVDFSMVTRDGFGDGFTTGVRELADTPYGLMLGGANAYYGLKLFRGLESAPRVGMPSNVEVDVTEHEVVLTWDAPVEAVRFHVFADRPFYSFRELDSPSREEASFEPGGFRFVQRRPRRLRTTHYYVLAEDASGNRSAPSRLVRIPVLAPGVSFESLAARLSEPSAPPGAARLLARARRFARAGDYEASGRRLDGLARWLGAAEKLAADVDRLRRRVALVRAGLLPAERLDRE